MADLIRDIDPNIHMEDEVEEILLSYIDEFVDRVLNGASIIAKHRHVSNIEVKDVQQFINRNFNMWVPGLGTDELKPYKRSLTTETHKQRLALIRKALKKY
ncbi:Transcription initiation factor TFIID subunit A [Popillia japonica]|uniref:Transcription initiation factor TFIID subunit 12 n=1 Tax=Popillia japonica TaxID=7064 RepID=A0AAW1HVR1_POPJA